MRNPENMPTSRVLPDGRRMPTVKGLLHTAEEIEKISQANKGRINKEAEVRKESKIWEVLLPFAMRRLSVSDMVILSGLTREQVKNAVYRPRPKWHQVENYSTPQEEGRRISRALKGKPRNSTAANRPFTQEEQKNIMFARKLFEAGLFTVDVRHRDELVKLFDSNKRELPQDSYSQLRLEIFLSALRRAARDADINLLNTYRQIGTAIDSKWFAGSLVEEEEFVKTKVFADRAQFFPAWADGEDEKGFFRLREDGKQIRTIEIVNSADVVLNSRILIERLGRKATDGR